MIMMMRRRRREEQEEAGDGGGGRRKRGVPRSGRPGPGRVPLPGSVCEFRV